MVTLIMTQHVKSSLVVNDKPTLLIHQVWNKSAIYNHLRNTSIS